MIASKQINRVLERRKLRVFDAAILPVNCRLIFFNYLNKGEVLCSELGANIDTKATPNVTLCINDSVLTDAFVAPLVKKNSFLICLSYGLIANLYACYHSLLSNPAVLPDIGDAEKTNCAFKRTTNGLTDFTYDSEFVRNNVSANMGFPVLNYSLDEDRLLYSRLLCDIAIEYCIYHEWGHIYGGHLQYLSSTFHVHELLEIDGNMKKANWGTLNRFPLRKVMEFEADVIASSLLLSLPERLQSGGRTAFHTYPGSFIARYDMRDAVYFALLALYHLFQEVRMINNCAWNTDYPIPYYRFLAILHAIGISQNTQEKEKWQQHEFKGAQDFMKASLDLSLAPKLGFTFLAHVYNESATKRGIVKLAKGIDALSSHLQDHRGKIC